MRPCFRPIYTRSLLVAAFLAVGGGGFRQAFAQALDLGDVTAGGDGSGNAPPSNTGIDPRTGAFVEDYFDGFLSPGDPNPAPGGSSFIDSVFIIGPPGPNDPQWPQAVTQTGISFVFPRADALGLAWNYILRDRNGGVSTPPIVLQGLPNRTSSAVGIHSAMGITYNLDALRNQHGVERVGCFTAFWGLDNCIDRFGNSGDANIYAILSNDVDGAFFYDTANFLRGQGSFVQFEIPPEAQYLTLATGSNGGDICDHGTFGHAIITDSPCGAPSFADLLRVEPQLISTDGGTSVNIYGRRFSPEHDILIGGLPLQSQELLSDDLIRGITPPLPEGLHQVEYAQLSGAVESRILYAFEAAPPPTIEFVSPQEVLPDGSTAIEIVGTNFRPETYVEIGINPLLDPVWVDYTLITGFAPPLAEFEELGPKQVLVADSRGFGLLEAGVIYVESPGPPDLTSVSPNRVSSLGTTAVTVNGSNFTPSTVIRFGGVDLLSPTFVSASQIDGVAPPLGAGEAGGPRDVTADDIGGTAVLPSGVTYVLPPQVTSVTPKQVSILGDTAVDVKGKNFTAATRIKFAGHDLVSPRLVNATQISGKAPALAEAPGPKDVTAEDSLALTTLAGGVTYVGTGVTLTRVEPEKIFTTGGEAVVFFGDGLQGLIPRIGGSPLLRTTYREGAGAEGNTISGIAPPLPAGSQTADLVDPNQRILASLPDAVEVVRPPVLDAISLLGPNQIEGSLAEGMARFTWNNPLRAEEIVVRDEGGAVIRRLAGDARSFELAVEASKTSLPVTFQSRFGPGLFSLEVPGFASRVNCLWPPPLTGLDSAGIQELVVYGGPAVLPPARCPGAGGEAGAAGEAEEDDGADAPGGGQAAISFTTAIDLKELGLLTYREAGLKAGSVISNTIGERIKAIDPVFHMRLTKHLFTGFTLEKDSDQLQIDAFYAMPVFAFDLKLRGRLIHVDPEDGFVDEFTFPDIPESVEKKWHGLTYFRADRDVSNAAAKDCRLKIPAGDYVLELYAVGGDSEVPHFVFQTDGTNREILIKGVPCPPLPRVKVVDLTGKRTLPTISSVFARQIGTSNDVVFTAHGTWRDENGVTHVLADGDPFSIDWVIYDRPGGSPRTETRRSSTLLTVKQIGCYEVQLETYDPDCPERRVKGTYEVPVFPAQVFCTAPFYTVQNPTPDPSAMRAVAGLAELERAGNGVAPRRRESFRVFILPIGCCQPPSLDCPAPQLSDLKFRLALPAGATTSDYIPVYDVPAAKVEDLCSDQLKGPKYFKVTVDFDEVKLIPGADAGVQKDIYLQALVVEYRSPPTGNRVPVNDAWQNVGSPLRMTNRPPALAHSNWGSSYVKADDSYHFTIRSSDLSTERFKLPDTSPMKFLQAIIDAMIPPLPSDVNAGLNTAIKIVNGKKWEPAKAISNFAGKVLGNELDGAPLDTAAKVVNGGQSADQLRWEWSDRKRIFEHQFERELFRSILWTGVIVVVPVTVWGSIGLGFDFHIDAGASVKIAPFEALDGGDYFQSRLDLSTNLDISVPAELKADILFGIVSQSFAAVTTASSGFIIALNAHNTTITPGARLFVKLNVKLLSKICIFWFLCYPQFSIPLLKDASLIDITYGSGAGGEVDEGSPPDAGGGEIAGGGEVVTLKELLTSPAIAVAPSGFQTFNLYFSSLGGSLLAEVYDLAQNGDSTLRKAGLESPELKQGGPYDLASAYIASNRVLIVSNATYPGESTLPFPFPGDHVFDRIELNELKAQDEIVLSRIQILPGGNPGTVTGAVRISDPTADVAPADRRADGRPAIAGSFLHGDAIAAWVRIEDREYLVEEPGDTTTIYHRDDRPTLQQETVPTVRPQLERSAIYVRRVDFNGPVDPSQKISPPGLGINLEPAIVFSPSGNVAICVWIYDATHTDLVNSNRGRNILFSVWDRATDTWSAPQPVLANGDDFPGELEPSIALKSDTQGLLAFNALEATADVIDSGLIGANRFVFACRYANGSFGAPFKVHGLCGKRVLGRYQKIDLGPRYKIDDPVERLLKKPEWVMSALQVGYVGSKEGAGNVIVTALAEGSETFSPPVSLTNDGRTHTNAVGALTAAGLHTINLKGPLARVGAGGGGIVGDEGYEVLTIRLYPDLALASCTLSDQFAGAGAFVKAKVRVDNRGLASSAADLQGASLASVRITYLRTDGRETVESEADLPVLAPAEETTIELDIEMPLDPVRLRAEVLPGFAGDTALDRDINNNFSQCFFGAPQPEQFRCLVEEEPTDDGMGATLFVSLSWTNPISYNQVQLFRDGSQIASLPGDSIEYVDRNAAAGPHDYEVRGILGSSKSARAKLLCVVKPPDGEDGLFRRGDVDSSGGLDISDPINLLSYLFLGAADPACFDAADADDSGELDITDSISILSYLFTGGLAPPAPGPLSCGSDPTPDGLRACGADCF